MQTHKKKLYMIGNAHIDPVWLWQWQDGYHETRATFRSALDRMQEYPVSTCFMERTRPRTLYSGFMVETQMKSPTFGG